MSEQEGPVFRMLAMDEKMARRQGLPFKIPVPESEFVGITDEGLKLEKLEAWIRDFLDNAPVAKDGNWRRRNSDIVSQLEGFLDKKPLYDKAQKLFADNDFEAAIKTLKRITIMMPEDHSAKMNYANALANHRDYDKAYKQLRQIKDTFEGEPDYHVTVAQIHVARGDEEAAIEQLVQALEHKPDHRPAMDALAKLGVLATVYEDPKDAASLVYVRADSVLPYLEEVWGSAERSADYYAEQVGYHASEGRWDVALAAAERGAAKAEGELALVIGAGKVHALRELDRVDEAVEAAQALVAAHDASAAAHLELSKSLAKKGDDEGARAALDAALERDPGDQEALVYKLWPKDPDDLQAVQGATEGIAKWAEEHPEVAGAWRSLARAKLVTGDTEQALSLFEKAVALAPDDDDLRSEWWGELARLTNYDAIIADAEKMGDMTKRDWKLRWNEAEAYRGKKRLMEARGVYMQINTDESLHVDIRKRAKRAAMEMGGA
ncbi:MAG: tetratricopeptide repeat protein [Polyangiaceae bacterium]